MSEPLVITSLKLQIHISNIIKKLPMWYTSAPHKKAQQSQIASDIYSPCLLCTLVWLIEDPVSLSHLAPQLSRLYSLLSFVPRWWWALNICPTCLCYHLDQKLPILVHRIFFSKLDQQRRVT
jgi:hypothetical protein